MINPTHIGKIEQQVETGEFVNDTGTIPEKEWQTVTEGPCKYEPEGQPFVREEMGSRVYKEARTHWAPYTVGEMVDVSEEEQPAKQQYQLDIGAGDDWRVTIEGINGVFAIREMPKMHSKAYQAPAHVTIEVERVDPSELGDS